MHFPSLIIVTFLDSDTRTSETRFVRAGGRVALTKLHRVHLVYRDVLHDKIGATEGCDRLRAIIRERPIYGIRIRVLYAFFCASIICVLSFGGSILDMFISGASAALLQYLGLNAASKSTLYANVYECVCMPSDLGICFLLPRQDFGLYYSVLRRADAEYAPGEHILL